MKDDVPLICDPVPGPPMIVSFTRQLSPAEVEKFRNRWEQLSRGIPQQSLVADVEYRFEKGIGGRTEWPDAEFCAA